MKKLCKTLLLTVLFANCLLFSTEYSFDEALCKYNDQDCRKPKAEADGRIQTLNQKGATSPVDDEATKQFIDNETEKKVLEIGAAYGKVMIKKLLKFSSVEYHINDLCEDHLWIAANDLSSSGVDKGAIKNVKFLPFDITTKIKINYKYEAILIARVLHFFSPEQLDSAIANIYNLLNDKGKIYVVAITPYVKRYKSFIPEYERRKLNNEEFPGYVKSLRDWINKDGITQEQLAAVSPDPFMFLGEPILKKLFEKHKFNIIQCQTADLGYKSDAWSYDGRENVILIAEKISK